MTKTMSKRLKSVIDQYPSEKRYTLEEAVDKVAGFPKTKFDETIELHFHLGIDPKASDQAIRGTVALPHGTGKAVRVAVFCKGELETKAKAAGADHVGNDDLIKKVSEGFLDFDVVIASPDMMKDLSKLGRVLGPRSLMPTPKAGTVTTDVEKAIAEVKAGKIEFKADKQAGIHVGVGKASFNKDQILDNCKQVISALNQVKPNSVKGSFIKSLSLSTTMGPGLRVAL